MRYNDSRGIERACYVVERNDDLHQDSIMGYKVSVDSVVVQPPTYLTLSINVDCRSRLQVFVDLGLCKT